MEQSKKAGRYQRLYKQLQELLTKSSDPTARMATIAAVLYHKIDYFFWCGFYRLVDGELTVGSYQGPVACQVLKKDIGVCWAGLNSGKSIIVPDVEKFPGHIACDSRSKSEIVVPLFDKSGNVYAVLDVDSTALNSFDEVDREWLERIVVLL
jgi:L-methionine (R)-S-oxide reductase